MLTDDATFYYCNSNFSEFQLKDSNTININTKYRYLPNWNLIEPKIKKMYICPTTNCLILKYNSVNTWNFSWWLFNSLRSQHVSNLCTYLYNVFKTNISRKKTETVDSEIIRYLLPISEYLIATLITVSTYLLGEMFAMSFELFRS